MWLNIIAVIVLVLFFSYFLKIKINVGDKNEKKDDKIEEEKLPSSSSQARYEESRYAFLKFAEFVLLKKDHLASIIWMMIQKEQYLEIQEETKPPVLVVVVKTYVLMTQNAMLGNIHQMMENVRNIISKIENKLNLVIQEIILVMYFAQKIVIGQYKTFLDYQLKLTFSKLLQNTVFRLNCKIEKLRNKATQVMSTSNVRYCYEKG